ncbi:MAG: xanthine dehydrogenase family protein molybdopterin-binding subunit [Thermomicrobiales bacterium]|nr:xanthine dehydrogenase family protein molybdopterin-binding subunit [Thermomicrobiales bacterium]
MTTTTVGTRARRLDVDGKVTGHARYASDYAPAGMLHGKIVRSDRPAARIVSIDTSAAEELPGVWVVLSGEGPWLPFGEILKDQVVFSLDRVRCAGEPLAAIAAETPEIAELAAQLIEVEYEDLPSVFDPLEALEPDAPLVHDDVTSIPGPPDLIREGNICAKVTLKRGNAGAALAGAHRIVEGSYATHSVHQTPMETRAAVAELDDVGRLVVHASTQHPFGVRQQLSEALGIGHGDIRVITETVGGGFGSKLEAAVEIYAALLTRATGQPVRMVNTREEDFLSGVPRHPMTVELQSAVDAGGRIIARKGRIVMDSGAYAIGSPLLVGAAAMLATGPYDIEHLDIDAYAVYTNNPPFGAYRGPTGPQMSFAVESHTDAIARELGVDPLSLRLLNVFKEGGVGPSGQVLTNVGMTEALTRAAEAIGYTERPQPVEPNHRRGKGLSACWWLTTAGSSGCTVQMNEDGTAVVHTGATEIGTGSVMAGVAQVVAEELGIPLDQVKVKWGDTDGTPMDAGAQGSRTMYNMGNAAMQAAQDARQQLLQKAADVLEAAEADLEVDGGRVYVKGVPGRSVSYADLMAWQMWATTPVIGHGTFLTTFPPSEAAATMNGSMIPAFNAPSYHCHAAEVDVDMETGIVRVIDYVVVQDAGFAINPLYVEGQMHGGAVQGIGWSLTEELQIEGGIIQNPNLALYKIPTTLEVPQIRTEILEFASADGPYGAKGVGEPPVIVPPGAIANAIADAIGKPIHQAPFTPERVFRAIHGEPDT